MGARPPPLGPIGARGGARRPRLLPLSFRLGRGEVRKERGGRGGRSAQARAGRAPRDFAEKRPEPGSRNRKGRARPRPTRAPPGGHLVAGPRVRAGGGHGAVGSRGASSARTGARARCGVAPGARPPEAFIVTLPIKAVRFLSRPLSCVSGLRDAQGPRSSNCNPDSGTAKQSTAQFFSFPVILALQLQNPVKTQARLVKVFTCRCFISSGRV